MNMITFLIIFVLIYKMAIDLSFNSIVFIFVFYLLSTTFKYLIDHILFHSYSVKVVSYMSTLLLWEMLPKKCTTPSLCAPCHAQGYPTITGGMLLGDNAWSTNQFSDTQYPGLMRSTVVTPQRKKNKNAKLLIQSIDSHIRLLQTQGEATVFCQ